MNDVLLKIRYRCDTCGRVMASKSPHICKGQYRKHKMKFTELYSTFGNDKRMHVQYEPFSKEIYDLLNMIPAEEQRRVFSYYYSEYCPIPSVQNGFLGFIENYKHLSQMIPKHWTIIDIGAYGNCQSYYFTEHKKYIAVEPSCFDGRGIPMFQPANCEVFRCTGQQFVAHILPRLGLNLKETFVIMNFVPSNDCCEVIRKTFPNLFIYYPSMGAEFF